MLPKLEKFFSPAKVPAILINRVINENSHRESPAITLQATRYLENGWWSGCFDYTNITSFLSGFIPRSNRDWANTLIANSEIKTMENYHLHNYNDF